MSLLCSPMLVGDICFKFVALVFRLKPSVSKPVNNLQFLEGYGIGRL